MQKHDAIIYEFQGMYSIIERAKQNPNAEVSASEDTDLTSRLPIHTAVNVIGSAVLEAIDNYGKNPSKFDPWDLKQLRKQLCDWVGAKSYPALLKNSRLILVEKDFDKESIAVIPFDNHNINPWETLLNDKAILLPIDIPAQEVGKAVIQAFSIATNHPERKDPPA